MNFITDNYIWFIISGGVLLLITIGYYAEQTGFGKIKLKDSGKGNVLINETDDNNSNIVLPQNVTLNQTIKTDIPIDTPIEKIDMPNNSKIDLNDQLFEMPNMTTNFSNNDNISNMSDVNNANENFSNNSIVTPTVENADNDVWKF